MMTNGFAASAATNDATRSRDSRNPLISTASANARAAAPTSSGVAVSGRSGGVIWLAASLRVGFPHGFKRARDKQLSVRVKHRADRVCYVGSHQRLRREPAMDNRRCHVIPAERDAPSSKALSSANPSSPRATSCGRSFSERRSSSTYARRLTERLIELGNALGDGHLNRRQVLAEQKHRIDAVAGSCRFTRMQHGNPGNARPIALADRRSHLRSGERLGEQLLDDLRAFAKGVDSRVSVTEFRRPCLAEKLHESVQAQAPDRQEHRLRRLQTQVGVPCRPSRDLR